MPRPGAVGCRCGESAVAGAFRISVNSGRIIRFAICSAASPVEWLPSRKPAAVQPRARYPHHRIPGAQQVSSFQRPPQPAPPYSQLRTGVAARVRLHRVRLGSDDVCRPVLSGHVHQPACPAVSAARRLGVLMIIGSSSTPAQQPRRPLPDHVIRDYRARRTARPFRSAGSIPRCRASVRRAACRGASRWQAGLDGYADLTGRHATDRIVAMAGVSLPRAVGAGAEVIIGGRSSDAAVRRAGAAPRLRGRPAGPLPGSSRCSNAPRSASRAHGGKRDRDWRGLPRTTRDRHASATSAAPWPGVGPRDVRALPTPTRSSSPAASSTRTAATNSSDERTTRHWLALPARCAGAREAGGGAGKVGERHVGLRHPRPTPSPMSTR